MIDSDADPQALAENVEIGSSGPRVTEHTFARAILFRVGRDAHAGPGEVDGHHRSRVSRSDAGCISPGLPQGFVKAEGTALSVTSARPPEVAEQRRPCLTCPRSPVRATAISRPGRREMPEF